MACVLKGPGLEGTRAAKGAPRGRVASPSVVLEAGNGTRGTREEPKATKHLRKSVQAIEGRPSGQPVPDRSPKNALTVNAEGLPMHTSLTRPVHPPVAPVVGRRHNRQLFHHLSGDPPVVEQSHNRRRNTIYFLIRRWLTMKSKRSNERLPLVFLVNNRRIKK